MELNPYEEQWIKATASALVAIRAATKSGPNEEQTRDINALADALHNINMVGRENSMFSVLHSNDALAYVERITDHLTEANAKERIRPSGEQSRPSRRWKIFG
jgi:hypothetical protein